MAKHFVNDIQQSGPRGGDKLFSTNWIMPMAQRDFGPGQPHPAHHAQPGTGNGHRAPLPGTLPGGRDRLRQSASSTGSIRTTSSWKSRALYDVKFGEGHAALVLCGADRRSGDRPHGVSAPDVGLGRSAGDLGTSPAKIPPTWPPTSSPRASRTKKPGSRLPDFTDASPTRTAGTSTRAAIDSYSGRLTVAPAANWTGTSSRLRESSAPKSWRPDDEPTAHDGFDRLQPPAAARQLGEHFALGTHPDARTIAALQRLSRRKHAEVRTKELCVGTRRECRPQRRNSSRRRRRAMLSWHGCRPTLRATHAISHLIEHADTGFGAQFTLYEKPAFLTPIYGNHPLGVVLFVRVRLRGKGM